MQGPYHSKFEYTFQLAYKLRGEPIKSIRPEGLRTAQLNPRFPVSVLPNDSH